jgi:hypothetical protein
MIERLSPVEARDMHQLNLFEAERAAPAPPPPNIPYIRKNLNRVLATARAAQIMPWNPTNQRHWESFFPELAALLPSDEGAAMCGAFAAELARLRTA